MKIILFFLSLYDKEVGLFLKPGETYCVVLYFECLMKPKINMRFVLIPEKQNVDIQKSILVLARHLN